MVGLDDPRQEIRPLPSLMIFVKLTSLLQPTALAHIDIRLPELMYIEKLTEDYVLRQRPCSIDNRGRQPVERPYRQTVTLSDATPLIPELGIEPSAEASGGFTGIIQITGPATKPKLELSSDSRPRTRMLTAHEPSSIMSLDKKAFNIPIHKVTLDRVDRPEKSLQPPT
jgi:hypothetical protein